MRDETDAEMMGRLRRHLANTGFTRTRAVRMLRQILGLLKECRAWTYGGEYGSASRALDHADQLLVSFPVGINWEPLRLVEDIAMAYRGRVVAGLAQRRPTAMS